MSEGPEFSSFLESITSLYLKVRRLSVSNMELLSDSRIYTDDPYYYLYFGDKPRPPSYFSLEAQVTNSDGVAEVGRVIRFDSLSKILSAGIRIGFATGPSVILDKIDTHVSLTTHIHIKVTSTRL